MRVVTKGLRWVSQTPVALIAFSIGMATGILLKLPLIPYQIPETAEKLLLTIISP